MSDLCVIGSMIMDMSAEVNHFPLPGQTVIANSVHFSLGGKGCNQCVAASRLKSSCEMIGMIGKDTYGEQFLKLLEEEHIKHDFVFIDETAPTGFSQIQIDSTKENKIVVIPGANHCFISSYIDELKESIMNSKLVMVQMELPLEVLYALIDFCNENHKKILLNPAPANIIKDHYLNKIDYLTPNETELSIISQTSMHEENWISVAVEKLIKKGIKKVIVTLGHKGCLIADSKQQKWIHGYKVQVKDTVAAGDAFNGALATALVNGWDIEYGAKFANAVGALTVTKKGAVPSLPTLSEVEKFLENQEVAIYGQSIIEKCE